MRWGLLPEAAGDTRFDAVSQLRDLLLERHPGFHETLMGWNVPPVEEPDLDDEFTAERMGRWYEAFLGRAARQSQGTFYTERPMIRRLLAEPLAHPRPRLLDPAMGCGAFLSEALAMRAPGSPEARWDFVVTSLFGVDRDPMAREIAVLALWLQAGHPEGDPRLLLRNLRVGNSLLPPPSGIDWAQDFPEPMGEGGFTAVVGNPPFVNVERLDADEKARYRAAFPDLQKRFDLFVPMASQALDLTRPGGHLALVLPQGFLNQAYAEPLRRRVLEESTLLRLEASEFPGAAVQTVLLMALKAPPTLEHRIQLAASEPETLPQAPLSRLPEARIPSRGGEAFAIALSAFERGIPLGEVAFATWGVRGVPIATYHRDSADHASCRPMIKGDGIHPYRVSWGGKYLRYEPELLYRPLFPALFEGEKIVLRKVSGRRGLVAALDREGYYTDDSVLCCQLRRQLEGLPESLARRYGGVRRGEALSDEARDGYDLPILLAVLNSRIGAMVFEMLLGNGLNVYPAAVMRLPLPPYDAGRFAVIRSLVERRQTASSEEAANLDRILETQLAVLYGVDATSLV
ncbi:putative type I restriction enzymeP M protein [compost metagenome]